MQRHHHRAARRGERGEVPEQGELVRRDRGRRPARRPAARAAPAPARAQPARGRARRPTSPAPDAVGEMRRHPWPPARRRWRRVGRALAGAQRLVGQAAERHHGARGERPVHDALLRQVGERRAQARCGRQSAIDRAIERAPRRPSARSAPRARAAAWSCRRRWGRSPPSSRPGCAAKSRPAQHLARPLSRTCSPLRLDPHGASSARVLSTSHTKNGAPISAVSTPIRGPPRAAPGARPRRRRSSMMAPPSMLAGSSRPGPVPGERAQHVRHDQADEADDAGHGGRRAHAERRAGDDQRGACGARSMPRLRAASSPSVSASSARPDGAAAGRCRPASAAPPATPASGCGRRASPSSRTPSPPTRTGSATG